MNSSVENFYAAWRASRREAGALQDAGARPPEKLLQSIWQQQRLRRDQLKTADGQAVRVLHPGFISVEGGPDFRGAVLKFGDGPAVSGDVEIDVQSGGWHAHGHHQNPHFKSVILHVVWDEAKPNPDVPAVLALKTMLDAPIADLADALENEAGLPDSQRGKCCAPLQELSEAQLVELLHAAARVRFHGRVAAIRARAQNAGWEQVLWENLFRALGYKHNVWPMQNLAETRAAWAPEAGSTLEIQARLLGVSGLLPGELTRAQKISDTFLRHAWDFWWRERDGLAGCTLPRAVWKFHGLRPANHPQRRLALAAHWLAEKNLVTKIEDWALKNFSAPLTPALSPPRGEGEKLLHSLQEIFQVERDEFWSWHWTFKSPRLAKPQPLLGSARVTDLAVNVVLPWLWTRAAEGKNEQLQHELERRFFAWPAAEDNSVLKLARQRLLGTVAKGRVLKTAAAQQGLMQIVRDFCGHSNAICDACRFPELVRGWQAKA